MCCWCVAPETFNWWVLYDADFAAAHLPEVVFAQSHHPLDHDRFIFKAAIVSRPSHSLSIFRAVVTANTAREVEMFVLVVTEVYLVVRNSDPDVSKYQDITGGEGPSNALAPSVIGTAGITTTTLVPQHLLCPVFPFRQPRITLPQVAPLQPRLSAFYQKVKIRRPF